MKAVAWMQDEFRDVDVPEPQPGPRDLLVRVAAVSVNPVDAKARAAHASEPQVLGWDAAGDVVAVGREVQGYKPGDRVYYAGDITRPGSNSQYQVVDERIAGRMPASLSYEHAAAIPLTALTAWEALFERLQVVSADAQGARRTILIIGAAGGVGSMAIQLAHRAGLYVIATASRPESVAWCLSLDADRVVDHGHDIEENWARLELPAPDYILCCADTGRWFDVMARLVAPQGRICALSSVSRPLDVQALMKKSAAFLWENIYTKSRSRTADIDSQRRILDQIADLYDDGLLRSTLTVVLGPLNAENLRRAHELIESGRSIGKTVLTGYAVTLAQRRAA